MNRFFLVWRDASNYPQGNTPRFRHPEFNAATKEAQRLARTEPGTRFFVVEAVAFEVCEVSEPKHTILTYPQPMLPSVQVPEMKEDDDDLCF